MDTNIHGNFPMSEIKISYMPKVKFADRPKVTTSKHAHALFVKTWNCSKIEFVEQAKAMFLNRSNHVIGFLKLSTGSTSGTIVDPKLLFSVALRVNASSVILAHNHPSGNLAPSQSDIDLTTQIKNAGKFLEIELIDHLIITAEGYYSFADEGVL
jgi:DNA repair protein RadC